jgi:hypothetical protein
MSETITPVLKKSKKIGMLKLICKVKPKPGESNSRWKVQCDCGNIKYVRDFHLKSGKTTSCGCSKYTNLVGEKIGMLEICRDDGKYLLCKCECGSICPKKRSVLYTKNPACDKCMKEILSRSKTIDLTDMEFGNLKVIGRVDAEKEKQAIWMCECKCGKVVTVYGYLLRKGRVNCSKKCGFVKKSEKNQE